MSLLEKAKEVSRDDRTEGITEESLELAQAWLDDSISLKQVIYALKSVSNSNPYTFLAIHAKELYRKSKLVKIAISGTPLKANASELFTSFGPMGQVNPEQEENRFIRNIVDYDKLKPKKLHWMRRPENREKVMANMEKMHKALRTARRLGKAKK